MRINGNGFEEVEAIFVCNDGQQRSLILLTLLQREQKIRVPTRYLSN